MKNRLSNIFESILSEGKVYGKKVIQPMIKRLGDSSDNTLDMLFIHGLFRERFTPIQNVKDLSQLKSEFNSWYNVVISGLIAQKEFIDDKESAEKYLTAYVDNIRSLGQGVVPFSPKTIEKNFIDIVNNNNWVSDTFKSVDKSIYKPSDDDVLFENEDILVLNADTKAKCVTYGQGESWCIGKSDLNYYNTYRINYGATPYYVLLKNKSEDDNMHKFVIMVYLNDGIGMEDEYEEDPEYWDEDNSGDFIYSIADRANEDVHGGKNLARDWFELEHKVPELNGLEKYFQYREVSADEKSYSDMLRKAAGYEGSNLQGYIDHQIKGVMVSGSPLTAEDFIRDYVAETRKKMTDDQLLSLSDSSIDSILEAGYFVNLRASRSSAQLSVLNPRQKRRHLVIKVKNGYDLEDDDIILLAKTNIDSIIDEKYFIKHSHQVRFLNPDQIKRNADIKIKGNHLLNTIELKVMDGNFIDEYVNKREFFSTKSLNALSISDSPEDLSSLIFSKESYIDSLAKYVDYRFIWGYVLKDATSMYEKLNLLANNKYFIERMTANDESDSLSILMHSGMPPKYLSVFIKKITTQEDFYRTASSNNITSVIYNTSKVDEQNEMLGVLLSTYEKYGKEFNITHGSFHTLVELIEKSSSNDNFLRFLKIILKEDEKFLRRFFHDMREFTREMLIRFDNDSNIINWVLGDSDIINKQSVSSVINVLHSDKVSEATKVKFMNGVVNSNFSGGKLTQNADTVFKYMPENIRAEMLYKLLMNESFVYGFSSKSRMFGEILKLSNSTIGKYADGILEVAIKNHNLLQILDDNVLTILLNNSSNPDKHIYNLLNDDYYMESYWKSLSVLLKMVSNKDEFINKMLSKKEVMEDLYNSEAIEMVRYSSNPAELKRRLLNINPRWFFTESTQSKKLNLSDIFKNL